eukprot:153176-Rhodomonas_salina.3
MTGRKDTAATGRDSAAAGKDAAKPAEHKPLDLGRVLQPEVFVSFFRPQVPAHNLCTRSCYAVPDADVVNGAITDLLSRLRRYRHRPPGPG